MLYCQFCYLYSSSIIFSLSVFFCIKISQQARPMFIYHLVNFYFWDSPVLSFASFLLFLIRTVYAQPVNLDQQPSVVRASLCLTFSAFRRGLNQSFLRCPELLILFYDLTVLLHPFIPDPFAVFLGLFCLPLSSNKPQKQLVSMDYFRGIRLNGILMQINTTTFRYLFAKKFGN